MAKRKRKSAPHRPAAGATPGTLVADPFSSPTEVRVIRYQGNEFLENCPQPLDFAQIRVAGDVLWVDVDGLADTGLVQRLGEAFGLHRLALEDVLYSHQSKTEDFGTHLQVSFPTLADESAATEQVSMFVGANFVLTFQASVPGDPFEPVRVRLREGRGWIRKRGPDYLAYALLDASIDAYFPLVDSWTDQLTLMEELVLRRPNEELWIRMCGLRGDVMALQRQLRHFREAIAALMVYEGALISKDVDPYYRDLHDHLLELIDALEGLRETTGELMQTFHARQSQKTNDIMQVLTIITTIFVPLTFVAGIYGMNFNTTVSSVNMPELNWRFGYPACLAAMVGIALAELWFFWKKGWLFQSRGFGELAGQPSKTLKAPQTPRS